VLYFLELRLHNFQRVLGKFGKLIVAAVIVIIDRQANASHLDSRVPAAVLQESHEQFLKALLFIMCCLVA
jgi:hypothetical protein